MHELQSIAFHAINRRRMEALGLSSFLEWLVKKIVVETDLSFWLALAASILSAVATLPFEGAIACHAVALILIWFMRYEAKREGRQSQRKWSRND